MDEDKDDIQGLLLGDYFEGLFWDLALGLEERIRDVIRASSPSFISRPPSLHLLVLPKGPEGEFLL